MPSRPIFIIGVHRSGTTLLRYMLSSSPEIYIPPESDFIPRFFLGRARQLLGEREVAQLLQIIFTEYRFVKEWQGDPPDVSAFLAAMGERTPASFLDTLYRQYAIQYGATRWGDKTPIYASYVTLIHELFPEAQFVHIIRDGRDVALSMLDKWQDKEKHVDIYFAARNWVRRIQAARAAARYLGPADYYELTYESLVHEPERQLRALCDFLDVPFVPAMLAQQQLAQEQLPAGGFHEAVRHPPTTARTGRWEREMTPADLRLVQALAGTLLEACGYALKQVGPMPVKEQARRGALAAKYVTLQAGRRLLQAAGVMPPI